MEDNKQKLIKELNTLAKSLKKRTDKAIKFKKAYKENTFPI